jgi:integrase
LLDALRGNRHGKRDWLMGAVMFHHGLRASELCNLQWTDIDFKANTIMVRRLKGGIDSSQYLTWEELRGLKELKREAKSHFVFIDERGVPMTPDGLNRMFQRAGEAADLPIKVHTHAIRHSTGYAQANRGMDTRRLQHLLGHKDISNTGSLHRNVPGAVSRASQPGSVSV